MSVKVGVPLLLERLDALAQIVRDEQQMLAGGLAGQCGVELRQRGAVDGLLGLGIGDGGSGKQSLDHLVDLGLEIVGRVARR